MLAQRVSRLWFGSVVAGLVLFGAAGTASAAPPTCDEPARVLYQLPAGTKWTHPRADCTDPDGDAISIEISEPPKFGKFDPPGTIPIDDVRFYTANPDAAGNRDTMKWRAVTRDGMSDPFQVDVWILPANSQPTCSDLALNVQAGASVAIAPECVDADGDTFVLRVIKAPQHGTYDPVRGIYTAAARFAGQDTMTFKVRDEWRLESDERSVTITVTQAPGQPAATGDKTAPTLTLAAKSPQPSRKALRRGIRLTATASEPGRVAIEALIGDKLAQKLGIETRVGSLTRNLKAGKATFKLRLYRKVRADLADVKRVRLRLVARMVDAAGNLRTKRLRVTLEKR
jgi:Bacterial Ig domain